MKKALLMKMVGIELRNFRSIGNEPVVIRPLKKCNILVGQNNVGKSNVCRAIQLISNKNRPEGKDLLISELDIPGRSKGTPFIYKLWFELDISHEVEREIQNNIQSNIVWFEFHWSIPGSNEITNNSLAENVSDFEHANNILQLLVSRVWNQPVKPEIFRPTLIEQSRTIFNRLFPIIPPVNLIPEFRQMRASDRYAYDGAGLIELLAHYQSPIIGKDADHIKFEQIQGFIRKLLHLPNLELEIPRDTSELILKNGDLRLPVSHYGTGVHELIILITAVVSFENSICCIEEPEIHLHPRMQRELIEFFEKNTNNQYIISTHSPTLINTGDIVGDLGVFHLKLSSGFTTGGAILTEKGSLDALRDLGIKASDLLQSNCVIWVEGPSDRIYISRWLELAAPDLREGREFVFMYYRELTKLNIERDSISNDLINALKLNQNMILVMDSDLKSESDNSGLDKNKKLMKEHCESSGGICWTTDGREIENYLPNRVISKACKDLRGTELELNFNKFDDISTVIDQALRSINLKPLEYEFHKKDYAKKIAENFRSDDFTSELREKVNALVSKIIGWSA